MSNALTDSVVNKVVKRLFGDNAKPLVRFSFVEDEEYTANDYLDMAVKLSTLGMKIDATKLKEATKLAFIDDSEQTWSPKTPEEERSWTPEDKEQLKKEL